MITSIHFENFKAFLNYTIYLKDFNILTGPNNNGKSTILDALRLLRGAYAFASRLNPTFYKFPDGHEGFGYMIPQTSIPIIFENVQTNYIQAVSKVHFRFKDNQSIVLIFSQNHPTYLYYDTPRKTPMTSSAFKKEFPIKIATIPTLGPLETNEEKLNEDYVRQWNGSRRAARMFRNYWFYNPENFEVFKELVEQSWPGMSIGFPEKKDMFSKELVMFYYEERIAREICWAGFGFQIWIQLLTHIIKNRNADILVVDEPEIYLHPDLQHKILDLLRSIPQRAILATHSIEIINNAEPSEVLIVDKSARYSKRISDMDGLQSVATLLGSGQNIQLTRLARGKKILFVEGDDAKILSKMSQIVGHVNLLTSNQLTVIPIEGFSKHEKILNTNWTFSKVLGEEIKIAALFDKDYRCQNEIERLKARFEKEISFVHFLSRKEIENYLLIPVVLEKTISGKIKERNPINIDDWSEGYYYNLIYSLTDDFKSQVHSQLSANLIRIEQKEGKDIATILNSFSTQFDSSWKDLNYRFKVVPGKLFLSALNEQLQKKFKIAITTTQIINNIRKEQIDPELITIFECLELFKKDKLANVELREYVVIK